MGKVTGFLAETSVGGPHYRPVPVRLRDWREVYESQRDEEIAVQRARCMDACGDFPFACRAARSAIQYPHLTIVSIAISGGVRLTTSSA